MGRANSLPNEPSMGCLVSTFTVGINSQSFPWSRLRTANLPNSPTRPTPLIHGMLVATYDDGGRDLISIISALAEGTDRHSITIDRVCIRH